MNKYRIIEYRGEYKEHLYIPRYIVQKLTYKYLKQNKDSISWLNYSGLWHPPRPYPIQYWEDLKEFNNLQEAKTYRRELDLDDGIVIE